MSGAAGDEKAAPKAGWSDAFKGPNAPITLMVMLGVVMYSLQMLIIITVMPTVVSEIGGGAWYVWASMLYQVGAIIGAASVGPVWSWLGGGRNALVAAGAVFAIGTLGSALSPGMLELVLSRGLQGFGGGLILGSTMGLVSRMFQANLRTRVLAIYQGVWSVCSLIGPLFGGAFAEFGWWRGAFWVSLPFIVGFCAMAWWKVPADLKQASSSGFPFLRILLLALGVLGVAGAGQVDSSVLRAVTIVLALGCIALTFRIDARAAHRMFPSNPLSPRTPVGIGYWVLIIVGIAQSATTILLPLTLQVVHEVTPLLVGVTSLINSCSWTLATFIVAGWAGSRERFALISGPVLMLVALSTLIGALHGSSLTVLLGACFILGFGVGIHHVHLTARIIGGARPGEETVTASSMSMVRSLGQAIGTASAGMVANMAGLGQSIDPQSVTHAVSSVFLFALVPLAVAAALIVRFANLVVPRSSAAAYELDKPAAKT